VKSNRNQVFIETPRFPIDIVNEASAKEKGPGRSPYWEMVFWWTRKPLAGARAVIAGALLPATTDPYRFKKMLRLDADKTPHTQNPHIPKDLVEYFNSKSLLDPFAGFGSIPLEATRLNLKEVVAVEFIPTAYVFLKAILEYPKKYGNSLRVDVEKWGKWIIEKLKEDRDVQELYDKDVAVYIGTWEVKCPACGRYSPLVGNWWLARVKGNDDKYKKLAWMKPKVIGDSVNIEVIDLNKIYGKVKRAKVTTKARRLGRARLQSYTIEISGRRYSVQEPNIASGANYAVCLLCGNTMVDEEVVLELRKRIESEARKKVTQLLLRFTDAFYRQIMMRGVDRVFKEMREKARKGATDQDTRTYKLLEASRKITAFKKLIKEVLKSFTEEELAFYPKKALNNWNRKLEEYLEGKISINELRNALARPRLLIKVKIVNKDLEFEPCNEEDNEKLWKALERLKHIWGDPDIPTEPMTPYGGSTIGDIPEVFGNFYKLFNSRQLITLVKLVKLIREAGKRIEEEKLREKWSKEEAFKYAEAVTTYLAMEMLHVLEYNSIVTYWDSTFWGELKVKSSFAFRGIAMNWNWCEYSIVEGFTRFSKYIISGLSFLISAVSSSSNRVRVLLDDATVLSKLGNEKFDVIVTDPPYRHDVPYTEESDFYYVWLKRALSDIKNGSLVRRFHANALIYEVQWKEFARKEISYHEERYKYFKLGGVEYYRSLMAEAFITMNEKLKDDGTLVTYFAHTLPEAWAELIEAGWKYGGFTVTNGFPLTTESTQSIVKRGKLSLDTSVVVVWRKVKGGKSSAGMDDVKEEMLNEGVDWARKVIGKYYGRDLFFSVFTRILSVATKYSKLYDSRGEIDAMRLVEEYVAPLTARALVLATGREETSGEVRLDIVALFYFITKLLYAVSGVEAKVKMLSPNDIILLSIATGADKQEFIDHKILIKAKDKNEYRFMEPLSKNREEFEEFLRARSIDPIKLAVVNRRPCSVDILHLMEYVTWFTSSPQHYIEKFRKEYPSLFDNALSLAKLLMKSLPRDLESKLCESIFLYVGDR